MSATTPTTDPTATRAEAADRYLAEVRARLGDLAPDDRDDLLDDLAAHVHEVAASDDRPLEESLGPPADFAAELVAAAGLAPGPVGTAGRWARLGRGTDRLRRRAATARAHPWTRAVEDFLPELRPGWWVLRGWLLAYGLSFTLGQDAHSFPFPTLAGNELLGALLAAAAIVVSVRLGRRASPPRWLWLLNGAAILMVLVLPGQIGHGDTYVVDDPAYPIDHATEPASLRHPDGSPITNIYAYDAEGRPLERVRLYDQDGRPIELGETFDPSGFRIAHELVIGPDGFPVENVYPQNQLAAGKFPGRSTAVVPPAPEVPALDPPATTTTTTEPGS
jgi:hypothetical protein